MMLKAADPEFSSIGGFTLTLAGLSQMVCLVAAAMIIERTSKLRAAEIAAMPDDQEVLHHEQAAEAQNALKERATKWSKVPCGMRLILVLAAGCATVATLIFAAKGSACFESVEVTTDLSLAPILNKPLNVIKAPYGYIALGAEAVATVLLFMFGKWQSSATKAQAKLEAANPRAALADADDEDEETAPLSALGLEVEKQGGSASVGVGADEDKDPAKVAQTKMAQRRESMETPPGSPSHASRDGAVVHHA